MTRIAELVSAPNFIAAFDKEMATGKYKTKKAAYEKLEAKRVKYLGSRKYKSYDSFRVVRRLQSLHLAKQATSTIHP